MVKGRVAPPKYLFHVAIHTKRNRYTLIEQSAHLVLAFTNTIATPYNYIYTQNQSSYSSP